MVIFHLVFNLDKILAGKWYHQYNVQSYGPYIYCDFPL
jgi:hypothetical protein